MVNLCRPIVPNGARCHVPALRAKPYCCFHTRLHRFTAAPQGSLGAGLPIINRFRRTMSSGAKFHEEHHRLRP
jgi:hypothetical protein